MFIAYFFFIPIECGCDGVVVVFFCGESSGDMGVNSIWWYKKWLRLNAGGVVDNCVTFG